MHAPLSHLTAPSSSGSNEGGGEVTRRHIHHTSVALRTGIVPAETLNADSVSATNGHPPPFPNRTSHPPNTPHFQPRFQWSPPPPPNPCTPPLTFVLHASTLTTPCIGPCTASVLLGQCSLGVCHALVLRPLTDARSSNQHTHTPPNPSTAHRATVTGCGVAVEYIGVTHTLRLKRLK